MTPSTLWYFEMTAANRRLLGLSREFAGPVDLTVVAEPYLEASIALKADRMHGHFPATDANGKTAAASPVASVAPKE